MNLLPSPQHSPSPPIPNAFRHPSTVASHLLVLLLLMWGDGRLHHCSSNVASAAEQCPQWVGDEIQLCVQPVAEFARTLNQQQQTDQENAYQTSVGSEFGSALQWPTKMGGQVFKELCRLINDFELCVDGHRDKCRRHITINLIEASYGFLCNEGYETFMASAECLMELDQQPSVKGCHDRTLREIEEANGEQNGTVAAKLDRMCNALNYFAECVRPPIKRNCGLEAWRVIFRVLKDTSRTLMPMCHFDEYAEEEEGQGGGGAPLMKNQGEAKESVGDPPDDEFGRGATTEGTPTGRMMGGSWERWEAGEEEEGDDVGGMGVHIEVDSSHQIHYGSHQGLHNGIQNTKIAEGACTVAVLFTIFSHFITSPFPL